MASVHLVDENGNDVPVFEKDNPPHDPTDPACWPAWCDNWFWEVDADERDALEAAAVEAECDRRDAPPLSQISDVEFSMLAGGVAIG